MRDNEAGLVMFITFVIGALAFVGGCSAGRSDLRRGIFSNKEICYEATDDGSKWKACYTLVKKSEVTPDKQESR
jgi:hypothetical protein